MIEIEGVEYLSSAEVLEDLSISRQTLWRWRQEGKVPTGRRFRDGRVVFTQTEVQEIREFAFRVEPIDQSDPSQLNLFSRRLAGK